MLHPYSITALRDPYEPRALPTNAKTPSTYKADFGRVVYVFAT